MTITPRRLRVRAEEGFTLVELLIAMIVLTVGILALVGAYSSGYTALTRASNVSSATVLADSQMERFHARRYTAIALNTSCGASCSEDATYTGDSAYSAAAQVTGCASTDPACLPSQTKIGPDNKSYRVDTFVEYSCPTGTLSTSPSLTCVSGQSSPDKLVTVVVRKSTGGIWVREQSTFSSPTGS